MFVFASFFGFCLLKKVVEVLINKVIDVLLGLGFAPLGVRYAREALRLGFVTFGIRYAWESLRSEFATLGVFYD